MTHAARWFLTSLIVCTSLLAAGQIYDVDLPVPPEELTECLDLPAVSLAGLPPGQNRCYRVNGMTGEVINGSLRPLLENRLVAGGGVPTARDSCAAELEICILDAPLPQGAADCATTTLFREVIITPNACDGGSSQAGAPFETGYSIPFRPLGLDDLDTTAVERVRTLTCIDYAAMGLPDGAVPLPTGDDLPRIVRPGPGAARLPLGTTCNLELTYQDSPPIQNCGGEFTVVRTFTLSSLCDSAEVGFYTRIWRIVDNTAPAFAPPVRDDNNDGVPDASPLELTTNLADECGAIVRLDLPGTQLLDECGGPVTLEAAIYAAGVPDPLQSGLAVNLSDMTAELSAPVPVGDYTIRYTYVDECGNSGATDLPIRVVDDTPPVAICRPAISVSLATSADGGGGVATINTATIDGGSSDNCTENIDVAIARVAITPGGAIVPISGLTYDERLHLTCADAGLLTIGLRVRDDRGNERVCTTQVTVTGPGDVTCSAASDLRLTCAEYNSLGLLPDLTQEDTDRLDAVFGTAVASGACETSVVQRITGSLNECGAGALRRVFTVVEGPGGPGGAGGETCDQLITVISEPDYTLQFPGDRAGVCLDAPPPPESIEVLGGECDMITTTVTTTRSPGAGPNCYDLAVNYRVINVCEYSPTAVEALEVPRDFDANGSTAEATYLHVRARQPLFPGDDVARLDRDADPDNGGLTGALVSNYGVNANRGGFTYTQLISVSDRNAPVFEVETAQGCFALQGEDCLASATVSYTLTDDCTGADSIFTLVEIDEEYDGAQFVRTRFLPPALINRSPAGEATLDVVGLPAGAHAVRITATDACGNVARRVVPLCVDNVMVPSPVCSDRIIAVLQPTSNGEAVAAVFATSFVLNEGEFCGQELSYSIYTEAEALAPGFNPVPERDAVIVDCDSQDTVATRVYAFNNAGARNYCSVAAVVQRADDVCDGNLEGTISGALFTENGLPIAGVEVRLAGQPEVRVRVSDPGGRYAFDQIPLVNDYTVSAGSDDYSAHVRGVSTSDLVQITRHILGVSEIASPYRLLAADANRDNTVTVQDIVSIRRLILGLDQTYPNNTAYRFVPAAFTFPITGNPWATSFPEVLNINLRGAYRAADFIGVMVGDVSGNGFR